MRTIQLRVAGRWAQFRKPETNNNPLTHDFITKTAFIGLIGAVLGKDRQTEMRPLFPQLCNDLRYGVRVNEVVKKESWGFTLRSASSYFGIFERRNIKELVDNRAPKQMEFLRDPDFTVTLALWNDASAEIFDSFCHAMREGEAHFTPVLGLHNCPAELEYLAEGEASVATGTYVTEGFVRSDHKLTWEPNLGGLRIGYEKIPAFQNDDWWNVPERYVSVVYPSGGTKLRAEGEHIQLQSGETWCLI